MKRQNRKAPKRKKSSAGPVATPQPQKPAKMTRRDMMGWAKFGLGAVVVVGGGGYYFASKVMADIAEGDLTKLGNGTPTVVQVHDPGCPTCRSLQREAREALEAFEDDELQYLVANLNSPEGRTFAQGYNAGRVTLLLFNGRGRMIQRITGQQSARYLETAFRRLSTAG